MNRIMKNTTSILARTALKTMGAIRVKTKTSDNKQDYNKFLQDNNIQHSKTGNLSFMREYQGKQTKIKIPSEYIGKKAKIQKFIDVIDANLKYMEKNPDSTSTIIENGKMYEQGKRNILIKKYVLPNGIESDAIETRTTIKQPYKERVK